MYQRKKEIVQRIFLVSDLVFTVLSFFAAYSIKTNWLPGTLGVLYPPAHYSGLFLLILPLWALLLSRAGIYEPMATEHPVQWALRLAKCLSYGFLFLVLFLFVLRIQFVSRLLLVLFIVVNFLALVAAHAAYNLVYRLWIPRSRPRVMLVGRPERMRSFLQRITQANGALVDVAAIHFLEDAVPQNDVSLPWVPSQTGFVQRREEISHGVHEKGIDEILIAIGPEDLPKIKEILVMVEEEGITCRIVADVFDVKLSRASWDRLGPVPMVTFSRTPPQQWQLFFKGVMDYCFALGGLLVMSPLFALLAFLVKKSSPGPVFFRQRRVGLRGRTFTMLKFRTMVQEAEVLRGNLIGENELTGPVFKMQDDPRVTRVGKFLRRHSLDELPQVLNVLAGRMSLVGPRPALPGEVAQYQGWQRRRLSMKPGMTGLWQVTGRQKRDFNDWVALDLDYIDRWSLALDLRILWKTLGQVSLGKGA